MSQHTQRSSHSSHHGISQTSQHALMAEAARAVQRITTVAPSYLDTSVQYHVREESAVPTSRRCTVYNKERHLPHPSLYILRFYDFSYKPTVQLTALCRNNAGAGDRILVTSIRTALQNTSSDNCSSVDTRPSLHHHHHAISCVMLRASRGGGGGGCNCVHCFQGNESWERIRRGSTNHLLTAINRS